jgi:Ion channel
MRGLSRRGVACESVRIHPSIHLVGSSYNQHCWCAAMQFRKARTSCLCMCASQSKCCVGFAASRIVVACTFSRAPLHACMKEPESIACQEPHQPNLDAGYGDTVPITLLGKMFASVIMLLGVQIIALPITVIGSNFSAVYRAEKKVQAHEQAIRVTVQGCRVLKTKRSLLPGVWTKRVGLSRPRGRS